MLWQRQAQATQQHGFEQYGKFLLKYTTQAEGLDVARCLTAEGRPYHMTSLRETIHLLTANKVIRQKAIKSPILTSEVNKYRGPVSVSHGYGMAGCLIGGFIGPTYHGWVVLAPGASETVTTPQANAAPTVLLRNAKEQITRLTKASR